MERGQGRDLNTSGWLGLDNERVGVSSEWSLGQEHQTNSSATDGETQAQGTKITQPIAELRGGQTWSTGDFPGPGKFWVKRSVPGDPNHLTTPPPIPFLPSSQTPRRPRTPWQLSKDKADSCVPSWPCSLWKRPLPSALPPPSFQSLRTPDPCPASPYPEPSYWAEPDLLASYDISPRCHGDSGQN